MLTVETRTGRSIQTRVLHFAMRNFKSYLAKPQPEHPAGSVRLEVPPAAQQNCTVTERNVNDTWLYDVVPKDTTIAEAAKKKRIYYFPGGGFKKVAVIQHWHFVHELACAVPAKVTLVSYPLAPHSPAKDSIPHLAKLYYTIMEESKDKNEEIIFMGDSAGGNIVLCLPLHVAHKDENASLPARILVIAPGADCRVTNPEIQAIDPYDPFLSYDYLLEATELWAKGLDKADPMVTPLLADFTPFEKHNVILDGNYGTWDVLAPDDKLLMEKAKAAGLSGSWLVHEEQMHVYPLTWIYGMPEAKAAKDWIVQRCAESAVA